MSTSITRVTGARNVSSCILDIIIFIDYNYSMKLYSVNESAQKLGLSAPQVRLLARTGKIKAKKLGHDWVVLSLNYKRKRRPKTSKSNVV